MIPEKAKDQGLNHLKEPPEDDQLTSVSMFALLLPTVIQNKTLFTSLCHVIGLQSVTQLIWRVLHSLVLLTVSSCSKMNMFFFLWVKNWASSAYGQNSQKTLSNLYFMLSKWTRGFHRCGINWVCFILSSLLSRCVNIIIFRLSSLICNPILRHVFLSAL